MLEGVDHLKAAVHMFLITRMVECSGYPGGLKGEKILAKGGCLPSQML